MKVDFAFSLVESEVSRLVILKSRPMSLPAYFLHLSFMKMSISCTCLLKSIVSVKYFESDFHQYFSYIVAVSFIGGGNRRNPEKTTDLPQVTDKL